MFSVQSLASSATDLSKSSGYSPLQIATATRELISLLQDDDVLRPLYLTAISSANIGPQRFFNNFRRLLKRYSENLNEEASDRLDYLAAQLVAVKARHVAQSILEKFLGDAPQLSPMETTTHYSTGKQDENSDEEDPVVDEEIFQHLVIPRDFLVRSVAFKTLKDELEKFVKAGLKLKNEENQRISFEGKQAEKSLPGYVTLPGTEVDLNPPLDPIFTDNALISSESPFQNDIYQPSTSRTPYSNSMSTDGVQDALSRVLDTRIQALKRTQKVYITLEKAI